MRDSVIRLVSDRRHSILRKTSAALQGRLVTLWRVVRPGHVVPEVTSEPLESPHQVGGAVANLLRGLGVAPEAGSLWLVCGDGQRWHVARVRNDVPAPPPPGAAPRSAERQTLELTGILLGVIERFRETADQATVFLCAALAVIEISLGRVKEADDLTTGARAKLLADLASIATSIDGALGAA